MNNKYSNFLTIILILIIIAILAIIGFLGFKYYETYKIKSTSEDFVDNAFGNQDSNDIGNNNDNNNNNNNNNDGNNNTDNEDSNDDGISFEGGEQNNNSNGGGSSSSTNRPQYQGFDTVGSIEIPTTKLKSPIIARSDYSPKALETAVVEIYGPGLNQVGNTTISGHNYRRAGVFFSDNKKLNIGDKIYIKDLTGKRLSYTIYDKFEAEENYADYMTRDTKGAIEISLSTCTDDSKARLIILAKADV